MSLIIEKINKWTYEITSVADKPFRDKEWFYIKEERKKFKVGMRGYKACFVCGRKFVDEDLTYLAQVKGYKPKLVCEDCRDRINGYDTPSMKLSEKYARDKKIDVKQDENIDDIPL